MTAVALSTFYFSRIVGKRVVSPSGAVMGRIVDLAVESGTSRPQIVAVCVKTKAGIQHCDFSAFSIKKHASRYHITCTRHTEVDINADTVLMVGKYLLDRQIVDVDGRKMVRVNDLRFATVQSGTYLVAVDVGLEGLLRRLGIVKPIKLLIKPFKITLSSHHILWDDVQTVDFGHDGIRLSKDYSNLERLHPSDLADIIEDMDRNTQIAVFAGLDEEKAADVLEELEPEAQVSLLENLPLEKAADLLELMPADEAADILDELKDSKIQELLNEMETESSEEIRELMDYPNNTVGSLMTTDFIFFKENNTINEVLSTLRHTKPEQDTIYYLHIVNSQNKLIATVSLRDIVVNDPEIKLCDIMNRDVVYVQDMDKIESINEIIAKYNLIAIPVVEETKELVGMVIINDIMDSLLKSRRKRL